MFATFSISLITIALVVVIHYEILNLMARLFPRRQKHHRYAIAIMLLGGIAAHVIEIWCFAFSYYFLLQVDGVGSLLGVVDPHIMDYSYLSFVVYTTLGFGDIIPTGHVRFLVGTEALTGLVMITWTASFLFMQMERLWRD